MNLLEGIISRKSIRAFKSQEVPLADVIKVLEKAIRAPSSVNLQPWEFTIIRGDPLERLKRACVEQHWKGIPPHPEVGIGEMGKIAPRLEGVYRERQIKLAEQIFEIIKIEKDDDQGTQKWMEYMYRFYETPLAIIILYDKVLQGEWPVFDIGIIAQTITLVAQEFGFGTCIMRAIVDYPEQVRKIIEIPESKRIVIGIALGYPDWNNPLNEMVTEREKIENILSVVG